MSRYDWESGTLKIPSAAWATLKKQLRTDWNQILDRQLKTALELFTHLKAVSKGQRRFDYRQAAEAWGQEQTRGRRPPDGYCPPYWRPETSGPTSDDIEAAIGWVFKDRSVKPVLPKKKDLPYAHAKTVYLGDCGRSYWDASIRLDDTARTLTWSVDSNNHAVERAWEHPMGEALNKALQAITWTRGSGGEFVGNDEYNQDDRQAGGGSNYVTRRFGPNATPQPRPRRILR